MNASANSSNRLALAIYNTLAAGCVKDGVQGNIFFSPASIFAALAMTYSGARHDTAEQMKAVMHIDYSSTDDDLHKDVAEMWKELLKTDSGAVFELGNRLWIQSGMNVLEAFQKTLQRFYGAEASHADFASKYEEVRIEINDWVAGKTNNRIKDLIPPGMLDPLTRLVLTNAVYFKGKWASPFDTSNTSSMPFFFAENQSKPVKMMHLPNKKFRYCKDDTYKCQVVSLPYSGTSLVMLVILPDAKDGLSVLEELLVKDGISKQNVLKWYRSTPIKVMLHLPRFKFTKQCELSKALAQLGMSDLFDRDKADLSGVTGARDLVMNCVIHKAFVEVNEEGTEAAAATAIVAKLGCAMRPAPPPVFNADHPFMFMIYDTSTNAIVFMGRVSDPNDME